MAFRKISKISLGDKILRSGNVGIGIPTPQNPLNVAGLINSTTGFITGAKTGVTISGTSCKITEITGGIITGATCS